MFTVRVLKNYKNMLQEPVRIVEETVVNRGSGAGGANTNKNGKAYEESTCFEKLICDEEWEKKILDKKTKYGHYWVKITDTCRIVKISQGGLKKFVEKFYPGQTRCPIFRCPDEAYFIIPHDQSKRTILKILEKKSQHRKGSVDTKILAAPGFIKEYEKVFLHKLDIQYAFNLNSWWKHEFEQKKDKWDIALENLHEINVPIFFGEDKNYKQMLNDWICSFNFTDINV